jgi:hypothetical protein
MRQGREKSFELVFCPTRGGREALWLGGDGGVRGGGKRKMPHDRFPVTRRMHGQPFQNLAPTQEKSGCGVCENHFSRAKPLPFRDS